MCLGKFRLNLRKLKKTTTMRKRYIVNPEVEGIIDDMTAQDAIKVIGGDGEPDLTVQTACTNNTPPPPPPTQTTIQNTQTNCFLNIWTKTF